MKKFGDDHQVHTINLFGSNIYLLSLFKRISCYWPLSTHSGFVFRGYIKMPVAENEIMDVVFQKGGKYHQNYQP